MAIVPTDASAMVDALIEVADEDMVRLKYVKLLPEWEWEWESKVVKNSS